MQHIRSAARISRAAAAKAALHALGKGTETTIRLADGDMVTGRIVDVGFRTVWLVSPASDQSSALDHIHRYDDIAIVGNI